MLDLDGGLVHEHPDAVDEDVRADDGDAQACRALVQVSVLPGGFRLLKAFWDCRSILKRRAGIVVREKLPRLPGASPPQALQQPRGLLPVHREPRQPRWTRIRSGIPAWKTATTIFGKMTCWRPLIIRVY